MTSTYLSSIFVTVAFASVPLENVIVGFAWNGVVVKLNIIFEPATTLGDVSLNVISEAGTTGALVQNTTPVTK